MYTYFVFSVNILLQTEKAQVCLDLVAHNLNSTRIFLEYLSTEDFLQVLKHSHTWIVLNMNFSLYNNKVL